MGGEAGGGAGAGWKRRPRDQGGMQSDRNGLGVISVAHKNNVILSGGRGARLGRCVWGGVRGISHM